MVKRKSLKFLSVALAVVVVGSALYYGTGKYISADVDTDGEWAYFKNLTSNEIRTIIFDAYVSNIDKGENQFVVAKKALVTYDDLVDGKISKVPVDNLKRYEYWQSYWNSVSDREPKYIVGRVDNSIAYAADSVVSTGSAKTDLKDKVVAYVSSKDDGSLGSKKLQTALSYIIPAINAGDITKVDSGDMPLLFEDYLDEGELIESASVSGIRDFIGGTTMSDLTRNEAALFNKARNAANTFILNMPITKTRYSRRQLLSAYEAILVEGGKENFSNPPRLEEAYFMSTVVPKAAELAESAYAVTRSSDSAAAKAVKAAGSIVAAIDSGEPLDGTTSVEDLPSYTGIPEQSGLKTTRRIIRGNSTARANTTGQQGDESVKKVRVLAAEAAMAGTVNQQALAQEAIVNGAERQRQMEEHRESADKSKDLNPVSVTTNSPEGFNEEDARDSLQDQGSEKTGWTGVGTIFYNPKTTTLQYKSEVFNNGQSAGYIIFDPENTTTQAQLHYVYKGAELNLYSEPTTGDVYLTYSKYDGLDDGRANGDPLMVIGGDYKTYKSGDADGNGVIEQGEQIVDDVKLNGIMSVTVGSNGKFGGSFRYMGRVFNYNPETEAFEVPITIRDGKFNFGVDDPGISDDGGIFERTVIYMDSKGGVRGNVNNIIKSADKSFTGSLGFSSSGVVDFTFEASDITQEVVNGETVTKNNGSFGSLTIDSTGNLAGAVNIGKLAGFSDVFVGFGQEGITGVRAPVTIGGTKVGINYTKNGFSFTGMIGVAGIPLPVSLGQNQYGGWSLNVPFLGSILKLGDFGEASPTPPTLITNSDGSVDASYIQMARYETSSWFKLYRFYHTELIKIDENEMYARAQLILDKYKEYLGRYPSVEEFMNFYFYSGHMKIGTECRNMDEEGYRNRFSQLELALSDLIKQGTWHLPEGLDYLNNNKKEYDCIQSGTEPTKCEGRPQNLMTENPFVKQEEQETDYKSIKDFLDYIEQLAKTDPEIERIIQEFINNHEENPTTGLIGDGEIVRFTNGFNTFVVPEYDQVVLKEISDLASATATVTPTMTASGSVTATETASSMPTSTAVKSARLAYIDTAPFINKGLEIFQYNGASANKWLSTANGDSIPYMKAGIGYYIYNPGTTVGVEIQKADIAETASLKPSLQKGWNLVANSGEKSLNLDEIKHSIVAGNDKTLVEMAKADEIYNRMYLIQDGTAIEATKAFRLLNPLATDTTQQIVGVLKPYWVYVK